MENALNFNDIGGSIVKQDDRYVVTDNNSLEILKLSKTILNPSKHTTGHSHPGQEEVYFFIKGSGIMELGNEKHIVSTGSIILVQDGVFHRVYATEQGCEFICVFNGKRSH